MEEPREIRCIFCNRKFAEIKKGFAVITPSTHIVFVDTDEENDPPILMKMSCGRCKKMNVLAIT